MYKFVFRVYYRQSPFLPIPPYKSQHDEQVPTHKRFRSKPQRQTKRALDIEAKTNGIPSKEIRRSDNCTDD
jgi:hypothetical protein